VVKSLHRVSDGLRPKVVNEPHVEEPEISRNAARHSFLEPDLTRKPNLPSDLRYTQLRGIKKGSVRVQHDFITPKISITFIKTLA